MTPAQARHIFSVDVEEYFHVSAFDGIVAPSSWNALPSRVGASMDRLLDLLARHETSATFFVLGWIARRNPSVVRRIAAEGHEIASHGWSHRRVGTLSAEELRAEARDSKRLLEDIGGTMVRGFRAPSFSIGAAERWALEVLVEEGYEYDSSIFPIRRPGYGDPTAPVVPHVIPLEAGALLEIPPATVELAGVRFPGAGGGYLRHLPFGCTRAVLRALERRGVAGMFYVHPWELDPGQPRMPVPRLTRIRHYRNLERVESRLDRLLGEFRFTSVEALLTDGVLPRAAAAAIA